MDAPSVGGTSRPPFDTVRAALEENLRSGEELGASIVVDVDGETLVDLWGGHRDAAGTLPWEADTITTVWSCTKTVTNLAALLLVERGLLDLDTPVARYWPEFAAAGKEAVLVRHVLGHTSGVSGWNDITLEGVYDVERSTARLATQAPWWEPGTASGYHAASQGHLVGELVRRTDGRSLTRFVADELAGPLRADFRIGARESDRPRIAEIVPPPPAPVDLAALDPLSPMVRTYTGPAVDPAAANTDGWRRAEIGAINGHGNARSLVRILSSLARGGGVGGVRLVSPETIARVFDEQADGVDLVLGIPLRWGIGYGLPNATLPYLPRDGVCFWGGWGGSMIIMDLPRRLTIGYVMNKMGPGIIGSPRSQAYVEAVYAALDGTS